MFTWQTVLQSTNLLYEVINTAMSRTCCPHLRFAREKKIEKSGFPSGTALWILKQRIRNKIRRERPVMTTWDDNKREAVLGKARDTTQDERWLCYQSHWASFRATQDLFTATWVWCARASLPWPFVGPWNWKLETHTFESQYFLHIRVGQCIALWKSSVVPGHIS